MISGITIILGFALVSVAIGDPANLKWWEAMAGCQMIYFASYIRGRAYLQRKARWVA